MCCQEDLNLDPGLVIFQQLAKEPGCRIYGNHFITVSFTKFL